MNFTQKDRKSSRKISKFAIASNSFKISKPLPNLNHQILKDLFFRKVTFFLPREETFFYPLEHLLKHRYLTQVQMRNNCAIFSYESMPNFDLKTLDFLDPLLTPEEKPKANY